MRLALALFTVLAACSDRSSEPTKEPTEVAPAPAAAKDSVAEPKSQTCSRAPDWRFERIELPPEFAPTLPAGVEKLYFAPGMFKPGEADYFTYVFSLAFNEPGAATGEAIKEMLELYYVGLISAVAKGKGTAPKEPIATVAVTEAGGGFEAVIETVDAFTTGDPVRLLLDIQISSDATCVNVAASPAERGKPVWSELRAARECVPCS